MTPPRSDLWILYRIAAVATVAMLVIIPVQIAVFAVFPPPSTVVGWFDLFRVHPLVALVDSDLLLTVNNGLIAVIYLAFWFGLKDQNPALSSLALMLGLVGIASYLSSTMTFEMAKLSVLYEATADEPTKAMLTAAGQGLVLNWQGTAFDAYYVLNGAALILFAILMLKSPLYGSTTAIVGLVSGFFMVIPSTAGTIGLVFSLLSLIPWYLFALRFFWVFRSLGRTDAATPSPLRPSDPR